jgi:oligopeptide/dipeptide ABC transporter ATP-binding protein
MLSPDDQNVAPGTALLRVDDLQKEFISRRRARRGGSGASLRAVDGVSFTVAAGECLAIVGESGSGKSTLARSLLRLVEPSAGSIYYQGRDLLQLSKQEMRDQRRNIQMIFQDPYASLHPRQTVSEIISEPWKVHTGLTPRAGRAERVSELLEQVGLPLAYASLYPSRLSGGERQRVAIARALALQPELLVLDEPVSALDVSIQAQVINVLMRLQRDLGLAYIFISHDLSVVRLVADRVAVMYMGKFVEVAATEDLYSRPTHPYTQALFNSSPSLAKPEDLDVVGFADAPGSAPTGASVGCQYRSRCPYAQSLCETDVPALTARRGAGGAGHLSACHFADVLPDRLIPRVPQPAPSRGASVASKEDLLVLTTSSCPDAALHERSNE